MDSTQKHIEQQRVLSFCFGYGGLDKGIGRVLPIRSVAYVEIEAFQNFNLVAAMESGVVDPAPIWTNLKTFDARPFHNRIHGIIGGYPCQGESLAGKRQLWNDDRFLWPYIERAIDAAEPFWVGFENVAGHISGSFPYVLDSLRSMGYAVEAGLFTASEVGAPHKRERLFIFGIRKDSFDREFWKKLVHTRFERSTFSKKQTAGTKQPSELAYSNSIGDRAKFGEVPKENGEIPEWNEDAKPIKPSEGKLDNSNGKRFRRKVGSVNAAQNKVPGVDSKDNGSSGDTGRADSKHELAHTNNSRSGENIKSSKLWADGAQQSPGNSWNGGTAKTTERWPSRPGEYQHEWEEKRTVKSGVGCTVNGYNFRTELLRQYGNGVVSQQASYAFETLILKLLNDNRIL